MRMTSDTAPLFLMHSVSQTKSHKASSHEGKTGQNGSP